MTCRHCSCPLVVALAYPRGVTNKAIASITGESYRGTDGESWPVRIHDAMADTSGTSTVYWITDDDDYDNDDNNNNNYNNNNNNNNNKNNDNNNNNDNNDNYNNINGNGDVMMMMMIMMI